MPNNWLAMQGGCPLKIALVAVYTQSPESAAAADPKKAHKGIKTLLSNCVMSAMRYNAHCKDYYERKLKEGKNKFTIFNAMKNKLVRLIFSLAKQGKKYDENYTYSLA
jgi:hypothetical protein